MPSRRGDPVVASWTSSVEASVFLDRPPAWRQAHGKHRERTADDRGDEPATRRAALLVREPAGEGCDHDEIDQKQEQDGMHRASIRRTAISVHAIWAARMAARCPGRAGRDCHRRRIWSNATRHPEIGRRSRGRGARGCTERVRAEPPRRVARRCSFGVRAANTLIAHPEQLADGHRHGESDAYRCW